MLDIRKFHLVRNVCSWWLQKSLWDQFLMALICATFISACFAFMQYTLCISNNIGVSVFYTFVSFLLLLMFFGGVLTNSFRKEELLERLAHDLQESRKELERQALTDALTGAHSRIFFDTQIGIIDGQAHRKNLPPLAVAFIDADELKQVNDTFGHDAGDELLKGLVSSIKNTTREGDILIRYGGDEFLVLCHVTKTDMENFVNRLRTAVRRFSYVYKGELLSSTASFGFALNTDPHEDFSLKALVKEADENMYKEKRRSKMRLIA